jgi:hypothetical protein
METLGLSQPVERSDGLLKSLFWPSVRNAVDVDYLATQGFWVCTAVAVLSFGLSLRNPILATLLLLFFYFGGVGVRQSDVYAAAIVFVVYAIDTLLSVILMFFASPWGMIVVKFFITMLLFSNIRATWIASRWRTDSDDAALPVRLSDTFRDRFADQWPMKIWPKVRIPYYVFGILVLFVSLLGVSRILGSFIVRVLGR